MSRLILLGAAVVALAGCADLGYAQGPYGTRRPDRASDRGRYDDYARTAEYRRITSDAADYARRVDASLRIGNGQERRIRDLLVDRTTRLLERTNARDHRAVYPFPRRFSGDSRAARSFWASADRDIERVLGRRDADVYRRYVRAGGRYDDRGQYDSRDRGYDARGRDDGERRGSDRGRADRRNGQAGRATRQSDSNGRRAGETLEEWYRRQARERQNPR